MQGDFGYSLSSRGRRVNTIIAEGFPASLDLGIRAMVIAIVFGIFFGIVAALNRGKPLDYLTVILVIVGVSVPSFVLAGVLQYWLGVHLKLLPVARYESVWHTIMPSFALALGTMAVIARYMRTSMLEIVNADYIRTARAKGLRNRQIVWRHQLRNALFPILTILGPTVAAVLTGSFVIESIFAIPGLGRHFVLAMQNLDYTLVLGLTVFFGVFLIGMNFLVDVAYGLIDPRIRHSSTGDDGSSRSEPFPSRRQPDPRRAGGPALDRVLERCVAAVPDKHAGHDRRCHRCGSSRSSPCSRRWCRRTSTSRST